MGNESLEIALIKYNKKTWSKSALLGFIIGLAVIVPGISGSTVAIIFKLYDQFLYALGNLFRKFKKCFIFLLPIGLGIGVGFLAGLFGVKKLLELNLFAVVCLFAGLMAGAFPAVKDEIKGAERTKKRIALFVLGLCIPVAIGCFSAVTSVGEGAAVVDRFADVGVGQVLLAVLVGFVVGITQIVPGLSASAFLMAVGWYGSLMESVSASYWHASPAVFLVYAGLGVGFLAGILGLSKLLTTVFAKARHSAYCMIVGLSLGSIVSMFCNGDVMAAYVGWANGGNAVLDLAIGVVLFVIGAVLAYALVKYQRKKDAENQVENTK